MFKGFDVKLPEYEVVTPQTGLSYHVRSLNVREEEVLKASFLTPKKANDHLNKCIFDSFAKKPDEIKNYDSWLKATTLKDRDALLYGLYHITYEDIRNYDVTCGNCQKNYSVTVKASETFNYIPYKGKEPILEVRHDTELPVTKTVFVTLKQPTLWDEVLALRTTNVEAPGSLDVLTETLIIEKFYQTKPEGGDSVVYSAREDIIDAYRSLAARDKRHLYSEYRKKFGQYGIELKMVSGCQHCQAEELINIDLVGNFFRMVYSF
jgi:hypothetical protein